MSVSPAEAHHILVWNKNVNALEVTKNSPYVFACLILCNACKKEWSDWSTGSGGTVTHGFNLFIILCHLNCKLTEEIREYNLRMISAESNWILCNEDTAKNRRKGDIIEELHRFSVKAIWTLKRAFSEMWLLCDIY